MPKVRTSMPGSRISSGCFLRNGAMRCTKGGRKPTRFVEKIGSLGDQVISDMRLPGLQARV